MVSNLANENDPEAGQILADAAAELARLVARAAKSVGIADNRFPIAASGGMLIHSKLLQDRLVAALERLGLEFDFNIVREPLAGCVRLAEPGLARQSFTWLAT
jgi:N-acetylglucosamine kinase-like BadF-type ATPase